MTSSLDSKNECIFLGVVLISMRVYKDGIFRATLGDKAQVRNTSSGSKIDNTINFFLDIITQISLLDYKLRVVSNIEVQLNHLSTICSNSVIHDIIYILSNPLSCML